MIKAGSLPAYPMETAYIVQIKVCQSIYHTYKRWLQSHIEGNAAKGIKGMMEIVHSGQVLFPSVELFTTDPIEGFHLLTVRYYTPARNYIDTYLKEYAPIMRNEMPWEFRDKTQFNRYIEEAEKRMPVGQVDTDMEFMFQNHDEAAYNLASFEVF